MTDGEPPAARVVAVTEWTMEMADAADLRPAPPPGGEMAFTRARVPSADVSRALYAAVGAPVCWTDRFPWTHADWRAWVERPELSTWIAMAEGTVAGFFEIEAQAAGDTEIHLVGLTPAFVGRGYGGHLVEQCVRRAWQRGYCGPRTAAPRPGSGSGPAAWTTRTRSPTTGAGASRWRRRAPRPRPSRIRGRRRGRCRATRGRRRGPPWRRS